MATLKQRLHRKNSSGTYDVIHLETSADCITGTLAIAHGGTGATTAANARTNLGAAASSHNHSAANITSGTLPVARGGTGLTSSPSLLVNLASTAIPTIFSSTQLRPGVTGTLPVARGGTGVTSLAKLKSQLGLSVGMYAETINFPFTISYSQPGSYGDYSANVNFTYNFNNPVVGCLLYCSNSYNPTLPEFINPPSDVVSTTFKQSHLLIVDNKDNIEKPLYNYSNDITSGSGGYFHFYNSININNFTSSSITLNITVTGSVYRYQHTGVMQQINGTISGFVVPIYSN